MRKYRKRRIKRAWRETFAILGYRNKSKFGVAIVAFIIAVIFIQWWSGVEQMTEQLRWALAVAASFGIVFGSIFIFYIIKPPAPKRRDANFVIILKSPPIVYGGKDELPPVEDDMQWVQAYINIEVNHPTEIQTLQLVLKGKPWMAYGWIPIMSNRMMNPRFYYFQVPTSVDLAKHKAQLVMSTSDEDYGSDESFIEQ